LFFSSARCHRLAFIIIAHYHHPVLPIISHPSSDRLTLLTLDCNFLHITCVWHYYIVYTISESCLKNDLLKAPQVPQQQPKEITLKKIRKINTKAVLSQRWPRDAPMESQKTFGSYRLRPRLLFPKLLMGFSCDRSY